MAPSPRPNGEVSRDAGKPPRSLGEPARRGGLANPAPDVSLLQDAAAYVHAVSARKNLVVVGSELLKSKDERIKLRALEQMLTMKFGKGSVTVSDEPAQIIVDSPRPERD